jgi:4-diphosphocytidyl-2-C-methyl-D-erythritol kinase
VSALLVESARAKINLTLRVIGRREDGYHELESLVAFADLTDTISLRPREGAELDITGPFAAACGPLADNLVLKAVIALRERAGKIKAGRFLLDKQIPTAAGIGGGSADAAAALRLLARANGFARDDPRLATAALFVGADVPVCLASRACVVRGVGDLLSAPLPLPAMPAVLVNPNVQVPTREVFAAFAGSEKNEKPLGNVPAQFDAMIGFLGEHANDLTKSAIACAPVITEVLIALRALPAVQFVRMSGSGPTCFALFRTTGEAFAAARRLQIERKDWWVCPTTIG